MQNEKCKIVAGKLLFGVERGKGTEERGKGKCHSCPVCHSCESRNPENGRQKSEVGNVVAKLALPRKVTR